MLNWMILPFKRYFDFAGRSRRLEYWMFTLLNVIVVTVLFALIFSSTGMMIAADPASDLFEEGGAMAGGVGLLIALYALIVFIPSIAVTVRRLHDRDLSGWWYLGFIIASMIPVVGFLAWIAFVVVMALPGTPGENRFGPDPKDPNSEEVFA